MSSEVPARRRSVEADRWLALLDAIAGDDLVHASYAARAVAELPSYAALSVQEHREVADRNRAALLLSLRRGRAPGRKDDAEVYRDGGSVRAEQGVTISDLLRAWSMFLEVLCERARVLLADEREPAGLLLRFVELAMAWTHFGMTAAAQGHQAAHGVLVRQSQHHLANMVRGVLFGDLSTSDVHQAASLYGIEGNAHYYAVRARLSGGAQVEAVERYLQGAGPRGGRNALVALVDNDLCGIVRELPSGEPPVLVGVSRPSSLREMKTAFRVATRAVETGMAFGRTGLCSLAALGVLPAIVGDAEVGEALIERYLAPLAGLGSSLESMLDTIDRLFTAQGRLEATARALGVHVNTVKYRLARFEQMTGASLRHSNVLHEAWWAVQRTRLPSDLAGDWLNPTGNQHED